MACIIGQRTLSVEQAGLCIICLDGMHLIKLDYPLRVAHCNIGRSSVTASAGSFCENTLGTPRSICPVCSLRRAGTSNETALLAAEFALLDEGLAALRAAIDRGQAALIGEQELDHLAAEIPDMRSRLGIR